MNIIETTTVTVGPFESEPTEILFISLNDGGIERLEVMRSQAEQLRWMDAQGALSMLVELDPDTNWTFSPATPPPSATAAGSWSSNHVSVGAVHQGHKNTTFMGGGVNCYSTSWHFRNRDIALMFKLAFGGA